MFDPVLDRLAADHEVVSVDLPGFGGSKLPAGLTPDPVGYATWLRDFTTDLGLTRPHVVGNSLGGAIALELGRRGDAAAVTAFSPIGFWDSPGEMWCRTLVGGAHSVLQTTWPGASVATRLAPVRTLLMSAMVGRPWRIDVHEARGALDALAHGPGFHDALDGFRNYRWREDSDLGDLPRIPVTIAWGTRDVLLPHRTQASRARTTLKDATHVSLPGCGHVPFSDDPDLCARVIRTST